MTIRGEHVGSNEFPKPHQQIQFVLPESADPLAHLQIRSLNAVMQTLWVFDTWCYQKFSQVPTYSDVEVRLEFINKTRDELTPAVNSLERFLKRLNIMQWIDVDSANEAVTDLESVVISIQEKLVDDTSQIGDSRKVSIEPDQCYERIRRTSGAFHDVNDALAGLSWNLKPSSNELLSNPEKAQPLFLRIHDAVLRAVESYTNEFPVNKIRVGKIRSLLVEYAVYQELAFDGRSDLRIKVPEITDVSGIKDLQVVWFGSWVHALFNNIIKNAIEAYVRLESTGQSSQEKAIKISMSQVDEDGRSWLQVSYLHPGLAFTKKMIKEGFKPGLTENPGDGRGQAMAYLREVIETEYGGRLFPQNTLEGSLVILRLPLVD